MERCCVEPLQVVEEESKRMLRPCKHADEPPEDQLEPALRVLWWKKRDGWLFSEDVLQLGDEVDNQQPVRTQRLTKGVAPDAQVGVGFTQQRTDQTLKGLRQRGIRNVALVLVELAGSKKAARQNKRFVQFVDDGGLTDPRVSGNEHQFRRPIRYDAVERSEQGVDFGCSPVQLLGD